jgi:tRNA threonylcarbamoyladenosine biosynthesis protein TsaE
VAISPTDSENDTLTVFSRSEDATRVLGSAIGESIEEGVLITLIGGLGAGKTRLVRAISVALSVDPTAVTSPTFVLIHEYDGRLPVYHFDAYRLRDVSEFLDLGAEEYMDSDCVCLIEWADRVANVLPEDRLEITISIASTTAREFDVRASGPVSTNLQKRIRTRLPKLGLAPANDSIS